MFLAIFFSIQAQRPDSGYIPPRLVGSTRGPSAPAGKGSAVRSAWIDPVQRHGGLSGDRGLRRGPGDEYGQRALGLGEHAGRGGLVGLWEVVGFGGEGSGGCGFVGWVCGGCGVEVGVGASRVGIRVKRYICRAAALQANPLNQLRVDGWVDVSRVSPWKPNPLGPCLVDVDRFPDPQVSLVGYGSFGGIPSEPAFGRCRF